MKRITLDFKVNVIHKNELEYWGYITIYKIIFTSKNIMFVLSIWSLCKRLFSGTVCKLEARA